MCNTRFNPGTTGSLHIGHIYMSLLNEYAAHSSGGKFHIRFADEPVWFGGSPCSPEEATEHAHLQLDELDWMGIEVDSISYHSDLEQKMLLFLANSNFRMVIDKSRYAYYAGSQPTVLLKPRIQGMALNIQHTIEKVVYDYWEGSDVLIRGLEWLQEQWLYMYLCSVLGFPFPKCYYISRLFAIGDEGSFLPPVDISKTVGNWRIKDLRDAGVTREETLHILRESCLLDQTGEWSLDNVKDQPRLTVRSIEDVLGQR